MIIRIVVLFFLTQSWLFACALCANYQAVTHVSLKVHSNIQTLETIEFKWELSKEFSKQLVDIYDKNLNKKIDSHELELIQTALVEYAQAKNFMTFISYSSQNSSKDFLTNEVLSYKTALRDEILSFEYRVKLNLPLKPKHKLHIYLNDDENYFILLFNTQLLVFKHAMGVKKELIDTQNLVFTLGEQLAEEEKSFLKENNPTSQALKVTENIEEKSKPLFATALDSFTEHLKINLLKVQQGDLFALLFLMLVSFGYGMVHAIGPGHGKALAFSYFSSHKSSVVKAFFISLASSFIHIVGALVLVLVSIFILKSVLNNFVNDSIVWLTSISALMIMTLALYLFTQKIKKKACGCRGCSSGVSSKNDLYFVLSAGLIPCAGTVILFIYAFVLQAYWALFLASLAISLGMSVVIFAVSFLGVSVHNLSEKSHKITGILEMVSPVVMFILGGLLLASVAF